MGQFRIIKEWSLENQLVKLEQELLKLKTPQRYLTGQVRGYSSNVVRVESRILFQQSIPEYGYEVELRGIFCEFEFVGDKVDKTVIPRMRFQFYNSAGQRITPYNGAPNPGEVGLYSFCSRAEAIPNKHQFLVNCITQSDSFGSTDAFYGDFWVVSNETGVLRHTVDRNTWAR